MTPIDVDLYRDDLFVVSDLDLYVAVEAFTRVASPPADRMQEGYLLDFKETWSISALRTVAAFANTFGGLLLVGVSEKGGRADQLVGIPSQRHELKTSIASAIASNISPTPPYEIREFAFPEDSGRRLCIVRVRKGNSLYLLTKKDEKPVYVRNEDESRPADAARLQALLATRLHSAWLSTKLQQPPTGTPDLYVTQTFGAGAPDQRIRSTTFLQVSLAPEEPLDVRLDLAVEQKFSSIVRAAYQELADSLSITNLGASFRDERRRDSFQIIYLEAWRDYEVRWVIDSSGALYFVTQVRYKSQQDFEEAWSLCDLMTNLDWMIGVAHEFWHYLNYPGEARIKSELQVEALPLLVRGGGLEASYASEFYQKDGPRRRAKALSTDALTKPAKQRMQAKAAVDLTYSTRYGNHAEPVALVTNQLLRDLGYAASLTDLRSLLL
jgi:hypothetical protein